MSVYLPLPLCRYNEKMTTESIAQSVSNLALSFGDDDADPGAMSRPFGVALLLAGCDDDKVWEINWNILLPIRSSSIFCLDVLDFSFVGTSTVAHGSIRNVRPI